MTAPNHNALTALPAPTNTQVRILAIVGMPGSGKSLLAEHLEALGYAKIRFGGITIQEVEQRGLPVTPQNEKLVREAIRANEGMDAYAKRSLPFIQAALNEKNSVIIDGLYSFSEYKTLRETFGKAMVLVAVVCDRHLRYARLGARPERPLTPEEAEWRDVVEIETLEKGGPIAIADYTFLNNGSAQEIIAKLDALLAELGIKP